MDGVRTYTNIEKKTVRTVRTEDKIHVLGIEVILNVTSRTQMPQDYFLV